MEKTKKAKPIKLTINHARKVLETVDAGLISGIGNPTPGRMCIEAAVCYALGMPHGDKPICVGRAVRAFVVQLNDSSWSSEKARAKGMRLVAITQLGSDEIDQNEFAKELALGTVTRIIPLVLRAAKPMIPARKKNLEVAALACEIVTTLIEASEAARAASETASDNILAIAADVAVQALIKCKSPGVTWLKIAA